MNPSKVRIACAVVAAAALALTLGAPATAKKDKTPAIAAFSGHTINTNPGALRGTNFVTIEIHRWTTDEERQAYLETLAEKGSDALVSSMRDSKERVGWIRLPGTTAYDLKYARQAETGDGRQIVIATDRPVSMGEVVFNRRTLDYGLTLVGFTMPPEGAGEGSIIVGAELELDNGQLTITNAAMNPVRFGDVKQTKP